MEIRKLKPTDAEAYIAIRLEALQINPEAFASSYEEEKNDPIKKYEDRFSGEGSVTFGVFDSNKLVGVVSLVKEQRNKIKHRANIFAMYVTPEKRKCGIGKLLMQKTIELARKLDEIEQIYITVVSSNNPAKKLYQSCGFKTYGIDKKAIKVNNQYYDEELMVLYL